MGEPKLCIAIIDDELALPTCELSITAQEARRLLIWVGKRKLGEQATDEHALQLAVPVAGRDTVLLTHPRQFRQLDHRSGRSAFSLYDRRAS